MGVVTERELDSLVAADRAAGRTIAFANGCFDVLHVGHVRYIAGATAEADRLIVAVNDDAAVERLKGSGRPVLPAAARAELVAALRGVDYVVIFPDATVARLLERYRPDVHCKGTDYTVDSVPERETVRAYGGRVAIVGDPKHHSTTELMARIRLEREAGSRRPEAGSLKPEALNLSILLVRLGALGDIVHAVPVAAGLRERFPEARIDWLVDERHAAFLEYVPAVSRRITVDSRRWGAALAAVRALRNERYDAAVDLQGLVKSAAFARLSGAKRVIGFSRPHLRERLAATFYTEHGEPPSPAHVVDKNLALLGAFGIASRERRFAIAVPEPASAEVADLPAAAARYGMRGYALLNPGAAWPNKRWPPGRFGELATALAARHACLPVVLWGPGEQTLAARVVEASDGSAVAAPATGIGDILWLSRGARLIVSGDTGPLHLAAAVGTPVVALFGPTDPARNGPWQANDVSLSRYADCVCHYERRCRRTGACIDDIPVDEVRAAIDRRLATAEPHA